MPYMAQILDGDLPADERGQAASGDAVRTLTVPRDWRRPADPRPWRIVFDAERRFGQVHPRPSPDQVAEFYDIDDYYTHAERSVSDPDAQARRVGIPGRLLASAAFRFERGREPTPRWWASVIPPNTRDTLEIGCGDGDRMRVFEPLVGHVRGIEPDPRAVHVARDTRGLDVYEGTAEALPDAVKDRQYGMIVFWHVLEHTLDPVAALRNAASLLKQDGMMAIEVPNNGCIGARMMGPAWRWLDAPRHLNFFSAQSLRRCAEMAGLEVIDTQFRGYVRQFLPDWIIDEATIRARLENREPTRRDIRRQLAHSAHLLARSALSRPEHKYDSVRILCRRL